MFVTQCVRQQVFVTCSAHRCSPSPAPAGGRNQLKMLNIIVELKKICNHPFLFESARDEYRGEGDESTLDRLVLTSGKMVLLDKLLKRLKETGHRVLIFSQVGGRRLAAICLGCSLLWLQFASVLRHVLAQGDGALRAHLLAVRRGALASKHYIWCHTSFCSFAHSRQRGREWIKV